MDERYRHLEINAHAGGGEAAVPPRMEPTFSLAFFRRCEDGAVIINAKGRVGFMNEAARDALGLDSVADVVQRDWSDLWPTDTSALMKAALDRVLAGEAVRLAAISAPKAKLDMLASPVINAEGRVESVFAVLFPTGSEPRISG